MSIQKRNWWQRLKDKFAAWREDDYQYCRSMEILDALHEKEQIEKAERYRARRAKEKAEDTAKED